MSERGKSAMTGRSNDDVRLMFYTQPPTPVTTFCGTGTKGISLLYDSVVSSQFDADRLDYMQRDRMMTGVQSSGIDATWLMANLEVGSVQITADDERSGHADTLVLGPKAFHAAENYTLSLFQLYPNVYLHKRLIPLAPALPTSGGLGPFSGCYRQDADRTGSNGISLLHKTTRAAEKLFCCLMMRIFELIQEGQGVKAGLGKNHPIRRFIENPTNIERAQALDDTVFWGAIPMLLEADDQLVRDSAARFWERRLPKCIDVRRHLDERDPMKPGMTVEDRREREARVRIACKEAITKVEEFVEARGPLQPQILVDEARRTPYKKFQDSKTPLNQILIRHGDQFQDMAHLSPVVASAETYEICRIYHNADDTEGRGMIENVIGTR